MSLLKDKPLKKCHTDSRKMIDDIHEDMIKDMNNKELNDYYLDNGLLLNKYYSNKDLKNNNTNSGILSYFGEKDNEEIDNENNRKEIINNYMSNIDDSIITYKNDIKNDICKNCNSKLYLSELESELYCGLCGHSQNILVVTDKVSYSDPQSEITYYTYKRINHFNEWLAQFQAKERTELPKEIFTNISIELNKNKHIVLKKLKYNDIREILKKLKYNKYYEHIPHILSIITGKNAPTVDRKSEEILRSLFKEIQLPFVKNCPPNRKNFLSYSYVLHKFCELLEYDHLLEYFSLLKSREKLHQQDLIWEKICNDLNWEFIPSL
jgi:ribosomal protein S27AE